MIDLVIKFVSWVKDMFSLIVSLPGKFASIISVFSSYLSFLPNGLGTVIMGLILTLITFVMVYAVVKLVVSLL